MNFVGVFIDNRLTASHGPCAATITPSVARFDVLTDYRTRMQILYVRFACSRLNGYRKHKLSASGLLSAL